MQHCDLATCMTPFEAGNDDYNFRQDLLCCVANSCDLCMHAP